MAVNPALTSDQYSYDFNMLYSVYSFPNVVLPFLLGLSVDLVGVRALIVVLALAVFLGHVVVAFGTSSCGWSMMMLGRVIFGFGGESVQVAQNA